MLLKSVEKSLVAGGANAAKILLLPWRTGGNNGSIHERLQRRLGHMRRKQRVSKNKKGHTEQRKAKEASANFK